MLQDRASVFAGTSSPSTRRSQGPPHPVSVTDPARPAQPNLIVPTTQPNLLVDPASFPSFCCSWESFSTQGAATFVKMLSQLRLEGLLLKGSFTPK